MALRKERNPQQPQKCSAHRTGSPVGLDRKKPRPQTAGGHGKELGPFFLVDFEGNSLQTKDFKGAQITGLTFLLKRVGWVVWTRDLGYLPLRCSAKLVSCPFKLVLRDGKTLLGDPHLRTWQIEHPSILPTLGLMGNWVPMGLSASSDRPSKACYFSGNDPSKAIPCWWLP